MAILAKASRSGAPVVAGMKWIYNNPATMLHKLIQIIFLLSIIALLFFAVKTPGLAQDENAQVGVVIKSEGGQTNTYCVTLPADKNTGLDALEATKLDASIQRGPLGASVCRLENVGCTIPAESCFCKCQGSKCNYWAYYYQEDGKWKYSSVSSTARKLKTGAVEGWLWNENSATPANALPDVTFEAICSAGTVTGSGSGNAAPLDPFTAAGYIIFTVSSLTIGGLVIWRRHHFR
jgi:hypothetical protein